MSIKIKIAAAKTDDLDEIMAIEARSFATPWSPELFLYDYDNEHAYINVAKDDQKNNICGYICFALIHDELSIMNLAVDPECRRKRIATQLLSDAIEFAKARGASVAFLEVRESHRGTQELYKKCGFVQAAVRRKYYADNGEDAILMINFINKDTK